MSDATTGITILETKANAALKTCNEHLQQEFKIVVTSKWGQFTFKMKNYPFLSWFSVKIINIYSFLWQNCQFIVYLSFENS